MQVTRLGVLVGARVDKGFCGFQAIVPGRQVQGGGLIASSANIGRHPAIHQNLDQIRSISARRGMQWRCIEASGWSGRLFRGSSTTARRFIEQRPVT